MKGQLIIARLLCSFLSVQRHTSKNIHQSITQAWTFDEIFKVGLEHVFNNGEAWREQRKIASYMFSTRVLKSDTFRVLNEHSDKLLEILQEASKTRQSTDMHNLFFRYTLGCFTCVWLCSP